MHKIIVRLPVNRSRPGSLELRSPDGRRLAGPFEVCGRADEAQAIAQGNPERNPLLPFGDTPFGEYRVTGILATGPGTAYSSRDYGPAGLLLLEPRHGDAALADANGRFRFHILAGDREADGGLRPTDGALRLSNRDQQRLVAALAKLKDAPVRCYVLDADGPGLPTASADPDEVSASPRLLFAAQRRPRQMVVFWLRAFMGLTGALVAMRGALGFGSEGISEEKGERTRPAFTEHGDPTKAPTHPRFTRGRQHATPGGDYTQPAPEQESPPAPTEESPPSQQEENPPSEQEENPPSEQEENQPEQNQPEENQPEQNQPEESQPQESQPEESQPQESQPEENQPQESQPEENQPQESQPEENQTEENQPQEAQPAQPEENQPQEQQPEENQPQEAQPAQPEENQPAQQEQAPAEQGGNTNAMQQLQNTEQQSQQAAQNPSLEGAKEQAGRPFDQGGATPAVPLTPFQQGAQPGQVGPGEAAPAQQAPNTIAPPTPQAAPAEQTPAPSQEEEETPAPSQEEETPTEEQTTPEEESPAEQETPSSGGYSSPAPSAPVVPVPVPYTPSPRASPPASAPATGADQGFAAFEDYAQTSLKPLDLEKKPYDAAKVKAEIAGIVKALHQLDAIQKSNADINAEWLLYSESATKDAKDAAMGLTADLLGEILKDHAKDLTKEMQGKLDEIINETDPAKKKALQAGFMEMVQHRNQLDHANDLIDKASQLTEQIGFLDKHLDEEETQERRDLFQKTSENLEYAWETAKATGLTKLVPEEVSKQAELAKTDVDMSYAVTTQALAVMRIRQVDYDQTQYLKAVTALQKKMKELVDLQKANGGP